MLVFLEFRPLQYCLLSASINSPFLLQLTIGLFLGTVPSFPQRNIRPEHPKFRRPFEKEEELLSRLEFSLPAFRTATSGLIWSLFWSSSGTQFPRLRKFLWNLIP